MVEWYYMVEFMEIVQTLSLFASFATTVTVLAGVIVPVFIVAGFFSWRGVK